MDAGMLNKQHQKPTLAGIVILSVWFLIMIAMLAEVVAWALGIAAASTVYTLLGVTLLLFMASVVIIRLAMAKKIRSAEDERIRKLDAFARGNAWSVSMVCVSAIFILMVLKVVEVNGFLALFIIFLTMGWSWMLFRAYYYFRGDVE